MALEFFRRAQGSPHRLGVLPGAFNPPTRAHLAIAAAALAATNEVLFVLPRAFPHKRYEGVRFEERIGLLLAATAHEPRFSVASSDGGLFIDIAQECRRAYGPDTPLVLLCGRDAAERIVNWDYGEPGRFGRMLEQFEMLVVSRDGAYEPPAEFVSRIRALKVDEGCSEISATEVRERIRAGRPWNHLVPESIAESVRELYGSEA